MIRCAAAAIVILALGASPVGAQGTTFTVTAARADVHTAPSTGSPIVGRVAAGKALEVTRELGSWVRIAWPAAGDGSAYVHVTRGTLARTRAATAVAAPAAVPVAAAEAAHLSAPSPNRIAMPLAPTPPTPAVEAPSAAALSSSGAGDSSSAASFSSRVDREAEIAAGRAPATQTQTQRQVTAPRQRVSTAAVPIPSHSVGIGGRLAAPATGFAASGRLWAAETLGVQVEAGRASQTTVNAFGPRVRTMTLGASAVYAVPAVVGNAVMVRPYFGGGLHVYRSTLSTAAGIAGTRAKGMGYQVLGGGEFTWAAAPNLAVSADLRRDWAPTLFPGFEAGGIGVGLSAHWYVK